MNCQIDNAAEMVRSSNAHGHQHVAVLVFGVGVFGAHLAGGLGVLEFEADFAFVAERLEEIEDVDGVEADDDGVTGVGRVDGVFALAGLSGVGADLELISFETQPDGARALVGELGHALDRRRQLAGSDYGELGVVARHHGFEVRELAGELARAQGAMADAEEERMFVVGELHFFGLGCVEQSLQLLECLARE